MNSKILSKAGVLLLVWLAALQTASGQGTVFTYQGQLTQGGMAVSGAFDFQFNLYNGPATNTSLIAGPLSLAPVNVTNGLFTVALDFTNNPAGTALFDGNARWLSIAVMPHGGSNGFSLLQPLQPITPAPYAITAGSVIGPVSVNVANLTGVVSPTQGGLGFVNTNWIANGAGYDNGAAYGYPQYFISGLSPTAVYFAYVPGNSSNNDQGFITDTTTYDGQGFSGMFMPTNGYVQLLANNPSTPVLTQIYLVTNYLGGNFGGYFYGHATLSLDPLSTVPTSTLTGDPVQFQNRRLYSISSNSVAWIISANDPATGIGGGSLLNLGHYGTGGYTDINFFTAHALAEMLGNPTLQFAIGVSPDHSTNNPIYWSPYMELYSGKSFWWVNYGAGFIGGVRGAPNFNFVWFHNGNTNDPMFEIDRLSGTITNYYPAVFQSNVTVLPTGQFVGNGGGIYNINASAITGGLTTNILAGTNTLHYVNGVLVGVN